MRKGFGFVYQSCRGTGGSQGEWESNVNERNDGLDTVNWLAEQPFVKNIGYWGDSCLALIGWCMADAVPDKVKTMCLGVYGVERHTSAYKDGLFRMDISSSEQAEILPLPAEVEDIPVRPFEYGQAGLYQLVRLPFFRVIAECYAFVCLDGGFHLLQFGGQVNKHVFGELQGGGPPIFLARFSPKAERETLSKVFSPVKMAASSCLVNGGVQGEAFHDGPVPWVVTRGMPAVGVCLYANIILQIARIYSRNMSKGTAG
nr:CocE/NonD family hydrolase [uncultured Acetatifactor sp.]